MGAAGRGSSSCSATTSRMSSTYRSRSSSRAEMPPEGEASVDRHLGSVESIGWRTDLRLRELEGAEIAASEEGVVIRTPENPDYRWGNFILRAAAPRPGEAERCVRQFTAAFPDADYVAIGLDRPPTTPETLEEFVSLGLRVGEDTVLTATSLTAPAREAPAAAFRPLETDSDWAQATALSLAT